MPKKEVADVLGGADTWKNVDKTTGESCSNHLEHFAVTKKAELLVKHTDGMSSSMSKRKVRLNGSVFPPKADPECR